MHNHWLFVCNVSAHLVASMSSIVSFSFAVWEAFRKQKIEAWVFFSVGAMFLIVAFDQAWQDEHRNAELVIGEKRTAATESNFWKDQSYQKDASIRSQDQLLAQNYGVLAQTQTSLAELSNKLVDVVKPEPQRIDVQWALLSGGQGDKKTIAFIARTNKAIPEVRHKLTCPFPFEFRASALSQKDLLTFMYESGQDSSQEASFSIQREWLPTSTLIAVALIPQANSSQVRNCTITSKR
jgi:hypothetical protein